MALGVALPMLTDFMDNSMAHPPHVSVIMPTSTPPPRPKCGRPRYPSEERVRRVRMSKKSWADLHREYVRAQIYEIQRRPEIMARRRELKQLKREAFIAAGGVIRSRGRPPSCNQQ
jgi:hypothetical protein